MRFRPSDVRSDAEVSVSESVSLFCAVGASRLRAEGCAFASECKSERPCFCAKPQKRRKKRRSGLTAAVVGLVVGRASCVRHRNRHRIRALDRGTVPPHEARQSIQPSAPGPGLGSERQPGLNSPWTVPRGTESVLLVQVRRSGPLIVSWCSSRRSREPARNTPVNSTPLPPGPGWGLDRGSGREIFVQVRPSGLCILPEHASG